MVTIQSVSDANEKKRATMTGIITRPGQSVAYRDIQNKIAEFLADQITLPDFQDWLAPIAWDIGDSPGTPTAKLVYDLELRIAEYDVGHLPRDVFVSELEEYAADAMGTHDE